MTRASMAVAVFALMVGALLLGLALMVGSAGLGFAAMLALAIGASMFGKDAKRDSDGGESE